MKLGFCLLADSFAWVWVQPPETTTYIHPTAKREDQELEERQHYYREWNAALAKSGGRFAPAGDGPRL